MTTQLPETRRPSATAPASVFLNLDAQVKGFDTELLRACRVEGIPVTSPYGPVVMDHDEVQRVLHHPEMVHDPRRQLAVGGLLEHEIEDWFSSLLIFAKNLDHRELRRSMSKKMNSEAFTATAAEEATDHALDHVHDGNQDAVATVATVIVDRLCATLCGISDARYAQVAAAVNSLALIHRLDPRPVADTARTSVDQVNAFLGGEVLDRDLTPEEREQQTRAFMSFLIGFTPLRLSTGIALHLLASVPEAWDRIAEEPELALLAADEVLRFLPSSPIQIRFAREPLSLRQHEVAPGNPILVCVTQANRGSVTDGDLFRPFRVPEQTHFSFGGGAHYCIAARPARVQLAAILRVLTRRLHAPELVGEGTWEPPSGVYGPVTLPTLLRLRDQPRARV